MSDSGATASHLSESAMLGVNVLPGRSFRYTAPLSTCLKTLRGGTSIAFVLASGIGPGFSPDTKARTNRGFSLWDMGSFQLAHRAPGASIVVLKQTLWPQ